MDGSSQALVLRLTLACVFVLVGLQGWQALMDQNKLHGPHGRFMDVPGQALALRLA